MEENREFPTATTEILGIDLIETCLKLKLLVPLENNPETKTIALPTSKSKQQNNPVPVNQILSDIFTL